MSRINLLPWRAERRKQRQKEFGVMVGIAAAAGVALWFLVNMYYNAQIDGQNERNAFLQQQIAAVDTPSCSSTISAMPGIDAQPPASTTWSTRLNSLPA